MNLGNRKAPLGRRMAMTRRHRVFVALLVAITTAVAACGDRNTDVAATGSNDEASSPAASPSDTAVASNRPIGGGSATGTGADVQLVCPDGVEQDTEEWFGPAGLTQQRAVAEAFGDLIVGWIGEPFEIETTDTWSSWGLSDGTGNLVAVATVVISNGGWDPSHARYCVIPRPTPAPPPFTLYVSNQSFEDPTVGITITIDGEVVVDEDFDVEGQHNWVSFEPDVAPGVHILHAASSTGAEFTTEFTMPDGEPRWAVVDY